MEKKPQLFILLFLVSFASVGAVLFTPGLPQMAREMGLQNHTAQLTVSIFLTGYAFGQLPWGPFANRFRRKPTLYFGISLQIVGAILCSIAGFVLHYHFLLLSIFILSLGSSVGLKITFTMIGDAFPINDAKKKIAIVGLSFAVAPAIGVILGGFIVNRINWQSCFLFLALYGVFLFFLSTFLPETGGEKDLSALKIKHIFKGFLDELMSKKLFLCAFLWGLGTAFIYLFSQMAPFIAINRLGIRPEDYGLLNFIPLSGMAFGLLTARFLGEKFDTMKAIYLGLFIVILGVVPQLLFFSFGKVTIYSLFLPMMFIYFGNSVIFTIAMAVAITQAKNKSYASALVNFIDVGTALAVTLVLSAISSKSSAILPIFFFVITIAIVSIAFALSKELKKLG